MAQQHLEVKEAAELLAWYQGRFLHRLDLLADFAGKELFAIHGESLLLHCIQASKVDFKDGFQLLHAVFSVEKFLSNLIQRGCRFHVVFFTTYEELCIPAEIPRESGQKYLVARSVIIQHLGRLSTTDGKCGNFLYQFLRPGIAAFYEYMAASRVRFFLCHDGSSTSLANPLRQAWFLSMIYSLLRRQIRIALINGVEFSGSKIMTNAIVPPLDLRTSFTLSHPRPTRRTVPGQQVIPASLAKVFEKYSVRDRITIAAICRLLKHDSSNEIKIRSTALILHTVGLRYWDLLERQCQGTGIARTDKDEHDNGDFMTRLYEEVLTVLEAASSDPSIVDTTDNSMWDLYDLIDGRVFQHILERVLQEKEINKVLIHDSRFLFSEVKRTTSIELGKGLQHQDTSNLSHAEPVTEKKFLVLPFNNPVLDEYLVPVHLEIEKGFENVGSNKIFMEISHWHNSKATLEQKRIPKPLGFYAHRRNQKFLADTVAYSASLTNATGKLIDPEHIVATPDATSAKTRIAPVGLSQNAHKPQNPSRATQQKKSIEKSGKQKALEAAQKVRDRKNEHKSSSVLANWHQRVAEFEEDPDLHHRYLKASKMMNGLRAQDLSIVGAEILLYLCNVAYMAWRKHCESPEATERSKFPGHLVGNIYLHATAVSSMHGLTTDVIDRLQRIARVLRIPQFPVIAEVGTLQRSLPFEFALDKDPDPLLIPSSSLHFQLQYCGPYLERSFDSQEDDRVPFKPDAWQRRVLDAIDENNSLFVIAPTSAGKTFISFYAMKKILQLDDDGVLVYVAPTKALVNQIAAEIQARFSKTYRFDGRSVWAIHTRDYRVNNPTGCQILVTVPHILQIMLLSPSNAEKEYSWSNRIKTIIFDEVHCIGQAENGVIWEQLLLMAPCPIIALSATVGNPGDFSVWLEGTQNIKGHKLEMIEHGSRYSDLRKYIYACPKRFKFTGLRTTSTLPVPGLDASSADEQPFRFVHPIAALTDRSRGDIGDVSLEPRDCLTLWEAMKANETEKFPLNESINPSKCMTGIITKSDAAQWEQKLKTMLNGWMRNENSPFATVRDKLLPKPANSNLRDDPFSEGNIALDSVEDRSLRSVKNERHHALPLLADLHEQDALPVILFNHERFQCERIMFQILNELKEAEMAYRKTNPEWKEKLQQYKIWKQTSKQLRLAAEQDQRRKTAKFTTSKDGRTKDKANVTKEDKMRDEQLTKLSMWATFRPEEPLREFRFSDETKLSLSEFDEMVKSHLDGEHVSDQYREALRRGLGVHHGGMNRRYRQLVEMLFRKGFLRVVVATGTLALGINMPCKTAVFLGDSIHHTALNYRQASGRAGRRGFDLLGNVVFSGIPTQRVFEIMSSRLSDLRGQFSLSVALILRVLGLLQATNNCEYATRMTRSLLSQTRLYLGGPEAKTFVQHHLRFSIEYLRRQRLISRNGTPLNFAGLVGHLYFTERSAFAFHALLKEGYFHELCAGIYTNREAVLRELALVMAHLFRRIAATGPVKQLAKDREYTSSIVLLPDLPANAEAILKTHNRQTLDKFTACAATFSRQYLSDKPDNQLPFSKLKVGPEKPRNIGGLEPRPNRSFLRSWFAALSGHTDSFASIHDLCANVREGVFLEESAIPCLPLYDTNGDGALNAYLYDFYKHGDITALERDNRIRNGDVWGTLQEFSLVLATIITSLTNFDKPDGGIMDHAELIDVMEAEGLGEHEEGRGGALQTQVGSGVTTAKFESKGNTDTADPETSAGEDFRSGNRDNVSNPRAAGDEASLLHVLAAFKMLRAEFDAKLRKARA
ncbi:hypothetical protein F4779DRAFT_557960 [Xylariaceae sp. FL0662B]|nr:hypothetical protein F4779DRAFT_557960 [Xylariaceae sp. FL0662B]